MNGFLVHSTMLKDRYRLKQFARAIKSVVCEDDVVVDLGAGTGILSFIASSWTKGNIYAVEYDTGVFEILESIINGASSNQIVPMNHSSFKAKIPTPPNVLITETLGPLGIDEGIVQYSYDFVKRHPSIRQIIPARVSLFIQPIQSSKLRKNFDALIEHFSALHLKSYEFVAARKALEKWLCKEVHNKPLPSDAKANGEAILVHSFDLGECHSPSFQTTFSLEKQKSDAIHIFFEADLAEEIKISTNFSHQQTHWGHVYFHRPPEADSLQLAYDIEQNKLVITWS